MNLHDGRRLQVLIVNIFVRNVKGMTEVLRRRVVGVAGCGGLGFAVLLFLLA